MFKERPVPWHMRASSTWYFHVADRNLQCKLLSKHPIVRTTTLLTDDFDVLGAQRVRGADRETNGMTF